MSLDTRPDRTRVVRENLDRYLGEASPAPRPLAPHEPLGPGTSLRARVARELFEDMLTSRALDVAAREMTRAGEGFYTISSAGHEPNVAVGAHLRSDDPCFLHYRSGALMMARARRAGRPAPIRDVLLGVAASSDDPVSRGRHKAWGSRDLWVPPQTSTIGSHLPKAVGTAFALSRARRLGVGLPVPDDAIVCCSFGDASANHATALAGLNAARYSFRGGRPTPVLFVCEDNRIGVSVDTPSGWIQERFSTMAHLAYFDAQGDLDAIWRTVGEAVDACRTTRGPVFLRLDCVRLWGHAGSDVETAYHSWEEIVAIESSDPLLAAARLLVESGAACPDELATMAADVQRRVDEAKADVLGRPRLTSAAEIAAPLVREDEAAVRAEAARPVPATARAEAFPQGLPEEATTTTRRTLAAHLNAALTDEMLRRPEVLVFGEDVGKKGGVYGVTKGLQDRFGRAHVFDTLLDETTILGVAQGAGLMGLLPVPEIQFLAYLHNAIDQLRGEACSLSFFSAGQFENPMVVRIAGLAYQKGFGGHFHNDNSIGAIREIPGIVLATPSRGDEAARLLRGCVALARACGRVVVFLEPIALYHERDLHEEGDNGWLSDYPPPPLAGAEAADDGVILPGEVGIHHPEAKDLLIASYANGLRLSLQAARTLERDHGVRARVLDLRWLQPLPLGAFARHAAECDGVLVVDECRATGAGVADALVAHLAESGFDKPLTSVRSHDTYLPLGPAMRHALVSAENIVAGALALGKRAPNPS